MIWCAGGNLADHPAPIFDVGSVKSPIIDEIEVSHTVPACFVPCHPISGSERAVPKRRRRLVRRLHRRVDAIGHDGIIGSAGLCQFLGALGASMVSMSPDEHDAALAVTSHLPHLLAFAFWASDGAASSADRWRLPRFLAYCGSQPGIVGIMRLNQGALSHALEEYSDTRALADAIERGDESRGLALIEAAAKSAGLQTPVLTRFAEQ